MNDIRGVFQISNWIVGIGRESDEVLIAEITRKSNGEQRNYPDLLKPRPINFTFDQSHWKNLLFSPWYSVFFNHLLLTSVFKDKYGKGETTRA